MIAFVKEVIIVNRRVKLTDSSFAFIALVITVKTAITAITISTGDPFGLSHCVGWVERLDLVIILDEARVVTEDSSFAFIALVITVKTAITAITKSTDYPFSLAAIVNIIDTS